MSDPIRLAIVATHPIQYYAPVFQLLAEHDELCCRVFYGWRGLSETNTDPVFKARFKWDVPLLKGYDYQFVRNVATRPGSHSFWGIDCPSLTDEVLNWNPDIVLIYGWCYRSHLSLMRKLHGRIPILFRGDSTLLDAQSGIKTWLRRRLLRWVYRHVNAALFVGENNRLYFEAHGLNHSQLHFAPHAIDNQRFSDAGDASQQAIAWREDLGIPANEVAILFVGKLENKKAPLGLLNAFAMAVSKQAHLIFAGSGPLESELRAAAVDNVHFIGFQNQSRMPTVYRLADLVVLPSIGPGETWGLALNEAMACGRPILASDRCGATPDLVRHGVTGWRFSPHDPDQLVSALTRAVQLGRESLLAMGNDALQLVQHWSFQRQIEGIRDAVCSCCEVEIGVSESSPVNSSARR